MIDWGIDTRVVALGPQSAAPLHLVRPRPAVRSGAHLSSVPDPHVVRFSYDRVYTSECVQCGGGVMELYEDEVLPTLRGHPVRFLDRFGGYAAVGVVTLILIALLIKDVLR